MGGNRGLSENEQMYQYLVFTPEWINLSLFDLHESNAPAQREVDRVLCVAGESRQKRDRLQRRRVDLWI